MEAFLAHAVIVPAVRISAQSKGMTSPASRIRIGVALWRREQAVEDGPSASVRQYKVKNSEKGELRDAPKKEPRAAAGTTVAIPTDSCASCGAFFWLCPTTNDEAAAVGGAQFDS